MSKCDWYILTMVRTAILWGLLLLSPAAIAADGGVLVLGGTGQLGSEIVKDLVEAGEDFAVLVRPTSDRARLDGLDLTYVVGNILDDADMERIFTSATYRAVIDASGSPMGVNPAYYSDSQRLITKWAKATNVGQIILHGATGAGDSSEMFIFENIPEAPKSAIKSKSIAEDVLAASGVPYTIIRHMTLLPLENIETGNARLTKDHTTMGAITRDGLARLTLECLDNADCIDVIFHAVDYDVQLKGRYVNLWKGYERILKQEYHGSLR